MDELQRTPPAGDLPALDTPRQPEVRWRFATALRQDRDRFGDEVAAGLAPCWRPEDAGPEGVSGLVAAEAVRLAGVLATAVEMADSLLLQDALAWLVSLFRSRGYDPAVVIPLLLQGCAAACRPLGPPALLDQLVVPLLDAAGQATLPGSGASAGGPPGPRAVDGA